MASAMDVKSLPLKVDETQKYSGIRKVTCTMSKISTVMHPSSVLNTILSVSVPLSIFNCCYTSLGRKLGEREQMVK